MQIDAYITRLVNHREETDFCDGIFVRTSDFDAVLMYSAVASVHLIYAVALEGKWQKG